MRWQTTIMLTAVIAVLISIATASADEITATDPTALQIFTDFIENRAVQDSGRPTVLGQVDSKGFFINKTGFDRNISLSYTRINESAWNFSITIDPVLKAQIDACFAKNGAQRSRCIQEDTNTDVAAVYENLSRDGWDSYPLIGLSKDVAFSKNRLDLDALDSFIVTIPNWKEGEEIMKIGYSTVRITTTTTEDATKFGYQNHLVWDGERWWAVYLLANDNVAVANSDNLQSWTADNDLIFTSGSGRDGSQTPALAFKNVNGNKVMFAMEGKAGNGDIEFSSGLVAPTGTDINWTSNGTVSFAQFGSVVTTITNNNLIWMCEGENTFSPTHCRPSTAPHTGTPSFALTFSGSDNLTTSNGPFPSPRGIHPIGDNDEGHFMLWDLDDEFNSVRFYNWSQRPSPALASSTIQTQFTLRDRDSLASTYANVTKEMHGVVITNTGKLVHWRVTPTLTITNTANLTNISAVQSISLSTNGSYVWAVYVNDSQHIAYQVWDGANWGAETIIPTDTTSKADVTVSNVGNGTDIAVMYRNITGSTYGVMTTNLTYHSPASEGGAEPEAAGLLDIQLVSPKHFNISANSTNSMNISIICDGGLCGDVNVTAEYDPNAALFEPVPVTVGATPLYNASLLNQTQSNLNDGDLFSYNLSINFTEIGNNFQFRFIATNGTHTNTTTDYIFVNVSAPPEAPVNDCSCPVSGDWIIDDGSICQLTTVCDLGSNQLIVNNGELHINGGTLKAYGGVVWHKDSGISWNSAGKVIWQ